MKKIVNEPREIDGMRIVQDSWEIAEALKNGETVLHWEAGTSMQPLINHMEYCKITPCVPIDVKRGDAVFCILDDGMGHEYPMVHQVWEISDASHKNELWFKKGSTMTTNFGDMFTNCSLLTSAKSFNDSMLVVDICTSFFFPKK